MRIKHVANKLWQHNHGKHGQPIADNTSDYNDRTSVIILDITLKLIKLPYCRILASVLKQFQNE
jgi:hypothetical protein